MAITFSTMNLLNFFSNENVNLPRFTSFVKFPTRAFALRSTCMLVGCLTLILKQNSPKISAETNNKFITSRSFLVHWYHRRARKESDGLSYARFGRSLWSAISCQRKWLKVSPDFRPLDPWRWREHPATHKRDRLQTRRPRTTVSCWLLLLRASEARSSSPNTTTRSISSVAGQFACNLEIYAVPARTPRRYCYFLLCGIGQRDVCRHRSLSPFTSSGAGAFEFERASPFSIFDEMYDVPIGKICKSVCLTITFRKVSNLIVEHRSRQNEWKDELQVPTWWLFFKNFVTKTFFIRSYVCLHQNIAIFYNITYCVMHKCNKNDCNEK